MRCAIACEAALPHGLGRCPKVPDQLCLPQSAPGTAQLTPSCGASPWARPRHINVKPAAPQVAHEAALAELGARLGAAEARAGELQARLEAEATERAAAAAAATAAADAQRERVAELEAALGAPLCDVAVLVLIQCGSAESHVRAGLPAMAGTKACSGHGCSAPIEVRLP